MNTFSFIVFLQNKSRSSWLMNHKKMRDFSALQCFFPIILLLSTSVNLLKYSGQSDPLVSDLLHMFIKASSEQDACPPPAADLYELVLFKLPSSAETTTVAAFVCESCVMCTCMYAHVEKKKAGGNWLVFWWFFNLWWSDRVGRRLMFVGKQSILGNNNSMSGMLLMFSRLWTSLNKKKGRRQQSASGSGLSSSLSATMPGLLEPWTFTSTHSGVIIASERMLREIITLQ